MKTKFAKLLGKIDALKPRERILVFLAGCVLLVAGFDALLFSPTQKQTRQVREEIAAADTHIAALKARLAGLEAQPDPNAALRQRIEQTNEAIARYLEKNGTLTQGLVTPERMPQLLESLLKPSPGLKLVSMKSLPPEVLGEQPKDAADETVLYRHDVELSIQGSYADLLEYMTRVERLPQKLYWKSAKLDALEHPKIVLTLTFYTLSMERSWLSI